MGKIENSRYTCSAGTQPHSKVRNRRGKDSMPDHKGVRLTLRLSPSFLLDSERKRKFLLFLKDFSGTIDEIAVFSGGNSSPLSLAVLKERAQIMADFFPKLRRLGFSAGINHLATFGHNEEGNPETALKKPWRKMTDISGKTASGCYCPSDRRFREYFFSAYQTLAASNPDFIWIDDDVRLCGFGKVGLACFCDRCLATFSRETGTEWTRKKLKAVFNNPGLFVQQKYRRLWLEHNREKLTGVFSLIRQAVDTINPGIPLGLMEVESSYSGSGYCKWPQALAGKQKTAVKWRPGSHFYNDATPTDILTKAHTIGRQTARLPETVSDIQSEVENCPYVRLWKSVAMTVLESAVYIAAGCTGAALNLTGDNDFPPFPETREYLTAAAGFRQFYEEEVSTFGRSRCEGIWSADNDYYFTSLGTSGDWFSVPPYERPTENLELAGMGLPMAYSQDGAAVTLLPGDRCLLFSEPELLRIFSGGVVTDAEGLRRLNAMGFSEYTGFEVARRLTWQENSGEVFTSDRLNGTFSGARRVSVPTDGYLLKPTHSKSRIISEFGKGYGDLPDKKVGPAAGVFENRLGGRLAVFGFLPWVRLGSLSKLTQLQSVCRWLSRESLPAYVSSFASSSIWCRRDPQGRTALFLLNPSLDAINELEFRVRGDIGSMTLTRMDCRKETLKKVTNDAGYSVFRLKRLGPWEAVLITQNSKSIAR